MDAFDRAQDQDEGYSEDPLNPSSAALIPGAVRPQDTPDIPAWLLRQLPKLPLLVKTQLAMAILQELPTSTISDIVDTLQPRLFIDFGSYLPSEIFLKILGYLDPVSLIRVAQTCRSYYALAADAKLWRLLYHLEGWKVIQAEIESWESSAGHEDPKVRHEDKNQLPPASMLQQEHLRQNHVQVSSRQRHPQQLASLLNDDDLDTEMADADLVGDTEGGSDASIFGTVPSAANGGSGPTSTNALKRSHSQDKGKGVPRTMPESGARQEGHEGLGLGNQYACQEASINGPGSSSSSTPIPKQTLRWWDPRQERYRINWKYLYAARRKLERNWEAGAFTNFQLPHPDYPEEGHTECIYNLQFDAQYLVSGSRDRTIRVWDMITRRLVRKPLYGHNGSVLCLQFDSSPDEDLIVSGSSDSDVILWRFSTGEIMQRLTQAHTESVLNVKFDGRVLVTCSKDKTIKVFNRRPLYHGDLGYPRPGDIRDNSVDLIDPVPAVIPGFGFSPSPRDLMPVIKPYTMIRCLEGHGAAVNAVQVHGREVVSASGDRHIKVWDWPDRVCRRTLVGHTKGIACVQYDGRRIVSGSNDYEVKVFDKETSLEVASLRSHSSLVRTVQSGFGDLPYSVEEDTADAKAVDAEYFKAVESGAIPANPTDRRRARNAGSRRPEDITAYGAKLPPGGGGGKYGRIVSGSYDQTIIIWRRDREGIWRPAHTLFQDEAAAAARRFGAANPQHSADGEPTIVDGTITRSVPSNQALTSDVQTYPQPSVSTAGPQSQASFHALVDSIVPQGPAALNNALVRYPTMLAYRGYIQTAIGREPNPWARHRLRQIVAGAMVRTEIAAQRARSQAATGHVATSTGPDAGSTPGAAGQPMHGGIMQHIASAQAGSAAAAAAAVAAGADGNVATAGQPGHHPHMTATDHSARIFKLQFDACRIICSSQASVIVGWDFCNGDPELEEASRFFATVD